MTIKKFTVAICATGAHCRTCCSTTAGQRFRERCIARFDMTGVTVEGTTIVCPFGGKPDHPPPARSAKPVATPVRMPKDGPGGMLHRVLKAMGYKIYCGCRCGEFARQMNQWGWWACTFSRRQEILDWLAAKAAEQGIQVDRASLWGLVTAARRDIRRRRKRRK